MEIFVVLEVDWEGDKVPDEEPFVFRFRDEAEAFVKNRAPVTYEIIETWMEP